MNLRDVPQVRAAVADVLPIIPTIWRGFDAATTQARTTIDGLDTSIDGLIINVDDDANPRNRVYDPHLFPHMVRYLQKKYLLNRDINATEDIQLDKIALSGLRIRFRERIMHLRKATPDDGIPSPGDSAQTREYYQLILSEAFACEGEHLLILWHATPFGVFKGLSLVCVEPGRRSLTNRMLVCVQIPDPAETDLYTLTPQDKVSSFEALSDLPIEPYTADDDDESGQGDVTGQTK